MTIDVVEERPAENLPAVADRSPAAMMLAAMERGATPEQVEKMTRGLLYDGLHPNDAGHKLYAQFVCDQLTKLQPRGIGQLFAKICEWEYVLALASSICDAAKKYGPRIALVLACAALLAWCWAR